MTTDKAQKFRALSNVLVSQGFNLWDARMEARRLLDIKAPNERVITYSRRHTPDYMITDRNHPSMLPTVEDRLELYFRSIVATCRSVIHGTAVFRSFSEFGQTWQDAPDDSKRNHARYSMKSKEFTSGMKKSYRKPVNRPKGYWRMVRLLEANGLNYEDARTKAQLVLTTGIIDSVQTLEGG